MYKGAQDKRDWMARTGSHATRERLHANITPFASHERGALPELKDEVARLRIQIANLPQGCLPWRQKTARLKNAEAEIKRLNREATETTERALLYRAMENVLTDKQRTKVNAECQRLRRLAEGDSSME